MTAAVSMPLLSFALAVAFYDDSKVEYGAPDQKSLLAQLNAAINDKDKQALLRLTHWTSLSATLKARLENTTPSSFSYVMPALRVESINDDEKTPFEIAGKRYVWNVTPIGKVVIYDKRNDEKASMVFGMRDNRYYLASRIEQRNGS